MRVPAILHLSVKCPAHQLAYYVYLHRVYRVVRETAGRVYDNSAHGVPHTYNKPHATTFRRPVTSSILSWRLWNQFIKLLQASVNNMLSSFCSFIIFQCSVLYIVFNRRIRVRYYFKYFDKVLNILRINPMDRFLLLIQCIVLWLIIYTNIAFFQKFEQKIIFMLRFY